MPPLPVIFIAGPTATGKTDLALQLADHAKVLLINVDAAQVYRGMNIGTAKPDKKTLECYPHALLDIRDPAQVYDVSQFIDDAKQLIHTAHAAGKLPVLVGGSLFYFRALEKGVSKLPASNPKVRQQIDQMATDIGWEGVYQRLLSIDPKICLGIKALDRQRIQRAMEIHLITHAVPSELMAHNQPKPLNKPLFKFTLYTPDRSVLHQRIAERFETMLQTGLVEEVQALKNRGDLHLDLPAMRCVGYRQVWQHLSGELDSKTMKTKAIAATRQLAKRQLTWLRHHPGQIWLSSEEKHNRAFIQSFLP